MTDRIIIGTRDSELAMWQTHWVRDRLLKHFPGLKLEIEAIKTTGDLNLDQPLSQIGDKGLFTKELDRALLEGGIDLAVHSLKDLPTAVPQGLMIAAITDRWDTRDALVSRSGDSLADLPHGAVIATGSLRRAAQLLHYRPDFNIVDIRGNLNTRFRKFDQSNWDAMILAVAGIERLGLAKRISEKIGLEVMLPAVGQGAMGVICREDDLQLRERLQTLNHHSTAVATRAERAMLKFLEGGCQVPIGAFGNFTRGKLILDACVCHLDGRQILRHRLENAGADPESLGTDMAKKLLEMGAREILDAIAGRSSGVKS